MQQQPILVLFLALAGAATIVFIYVFVSSKKQHRQIKACPIR